MDLDEDQLKENSERLTCFMKQTSNGKLLEIFHFSQSDSKCGVMSAVFLIKTN